MKQGTQLNLWLLLGTLLLGGLNWFEPGLQPTEFPPLTRIDPASVNEINLYQGERLSLSLLRDAEGWVVSHPSVGRAQPQKVERLLHIGQMPSLHRFPLDPGRLAEFGLDPPGYRLQLGTTEIAFGGIDPVTQLRYARSGEQVHLVSDGYYHHLGSPPPSYLQTP